MAIIPWRGSWKEVSEGLRRLQDHVSSYERRFREVERDDIADDLETCIQLLSGAQAVATECYLKGLD